MTDRELTQAKRAAAALLASPKPPKPRRKPTRKPIKNKRRARVCRTCYGFRTVHRFHGDRFAEIPCPTCRPQPCPTS